MARRDDDFDELLADLETTLGDLRETLREEQGERRPMRPPSPGELLRFTEEYTIPTVISVLEANIRALKLLQQLLRLADPARSLEEGTRSVRDRLASADTRGTATVAGEAALDQFERALADLQTALRESDLPTDGEARSIVEEARSLSNEIERRVVESERSRSERSESARSESAARSERARTGERRRDEWDDDRSRGVRIDVGEEGASEASDDETADDPTGEPDSGVDVEAELETIREEVRGADERDAAADDGDAADAGETSSDERGQTGSNR
jgi:hypothetical protein